MQKFTYLSFIIKILIFLPLWGLGGFAFSQNKVLDSLLKITENNPKQDTNLLKNYYFIGQNYFSQNNTAKTVIYGEKTIKLAKELKSTKFEALANSQLGYAYFLLGDIPQSLQYAQKGVNIAEEAKSDIVLVNALNILGKVYEGQQKPQESKKLYEKVLKIHEKNLEKNPKNLNIQSNIALTYNNLGNAATMMGDADSSIEYQKKAIKIRENIPQEAPNLTFSYNDIAYAYDVKKDVKNAGIYYEKARENVEKSKDSLYIGLIYSNVAQHYANTQQYEKALYYGEIALKITKKSNTKNIILQTANVLADVYAIKKNFEKALAYKDIVLTYTDSVYNEKRLTEITKIEQNYALDKEKKKTEILEKEKIIRDTKIQEQFYIILFSLLGAGLLVVLATFLWRNNKLKQKNNELLLEKNEEINQQNEEIKQIADSLHEANEAITAKNLMISEHNKNMTDNIAYAQHIQEAMLPTKEKFLEFLPNHFIFYQPKDVVSGDFYFFENIEQKSVLCAIDCTGHGVSGAFMTILANDILTNIVVHQHILSPDIILNELHKAIRKSLKQDSTQNRDGMDMVVVAIDHANKKLEFAGAKNPLLMIKNNEIELIKGDRFCVGGEQKENERIFTKHIFDLNEENETYFYVFSDGFQDQFGGKNKEKFRSARLKDLILENYQKPFAQQNNILKTTLEDWKNEGHEAQTDDILVIGFKV